MFSLDSPGCDRIHVPFRLWLKKENRPGLSVLFSVASIALRLFMFVLLFVRGKALCLWIVPP